MRKSAVLLCFVLPCLALACGTNDSIQQATRPKSERFQLIRTISPVEISSLNKFMVQQDKLYASDHNSKLYIFTLDGQLQACFSGEGEGPGELKLLTDFTLYKNQLVAVGYPRKMLRFDLRGNLIEEVKLPKQATGLLRVDSDLCYVTRPLIPRSDSNLKDYFYQVLDLDNGQKRFSKLDDTVQFDQEGRPFPYLVAPFPNFKFFVNTIDGCSFIFSAQEKNFYVWEKDHFEQSDLKFPLPETPITEQDKQDFFQQIKKANSAEMAERMKKSVQFPAHKEYFMGVIPWRNKLALIRLDSFIIITPQGDFVEKIALPKKMRPESYWDFFYISKKMQLYENHLYYLNENEEALQVFEFSAPL